MPLVTYNDNGVKEIFDVRSCRVLVQMGINYFLVRIYSSARLVGSKLGALKFPFVDALLYASYCYLICLGPPIGFGSYLEQPSTNFELEHSIIVFYLLPTTPRL